MPAKRPLADGPLILKRSTDETTKIADRIARANGTGIFNSGKRTVVSNQPSVVLGWIPAKTSGKKK